MDESIVTLKLPAGLVGERLVFEEIIVTRLDASRFRLLRSPGIVLGLAAGDELELSADSPLGYRLLKRGGNVAIQIVVGSAYRRPCRLALEENVAKLGGRLDGETVVGDKANLVYTVPISRGFGRIEQVFMRAMEVAEDVQINYGNVYDIADGKTPLNWWQCPNGSVERSTDSGS